MNTSPLQMRKSEAERIEELQRMIKALRDGTDTELVELVRMILQHQNGSKNGGWSSKVMQVVVFPLLVAGIIGGVALYGQVQALKAEIQQCEKKP